MQCSAHSACLQQQVSHDTIDDTKRLGIAMGQLVCYKSPVDDLASHARQGTALQGFVMPCIRGETIRGVWCISLKSTAELCVGVLCDVQKCSHGLYVMLRSFEFARTA